MESKIRRRKVLKDFLTILIILTGILYISYVTWSETFKPPPTFMPDDGSIFINPDVIWIPSMIFMVGLILVVSIAYVISARNLPHLPLENFKKRPNVAISYSRNGQSHSLIKNSHDILSELQNSQRLTQIIDEENLEDLTELTLLTKDIIKKIDQINWEDENQKKEFIIEILALTPEEREEIIDYMLIKSREG